MKIRIFMSEELAIKVAVENVESPVQKIAAVDLEKNPHEAMGMPPLPYKTYLSFGPLIEALKSDFDNKEVANESMLSQAVHDLMDSVPELKGRIEDYSLLEKHRSVVELLISSVLPPVSKQNRLAKLSKPFEMEAFYQTPAVDKMMKNHSMTYEINRSGDLMACAATVSSGSLILNRFYGQNLKIAPPILISAQEEGVETRRFFKLNMDTSFTEIVPLKPLKKLTKNQINFLLSNIYDRDAWLDAMPPDAFEFRGFIMTNLVEITEEESVSRLKQDLLQRNAIVNIENVKKLESIVRNYLEVPGLRLGITAIDYPRERAIAHKYKIRFNFLADTIYDLLDEAYENSIYERTCKYKEVLLIEDLQELEDKTEIEEQLLAKGIRSIIVAPLFNSEREVIGLLEIGAPKPFALHSFIELKFKDITSLFSIAIERSRSEIDNQIEALIREQFTDIHSSMEWKFIEASYNLLEKRENGENARMEPIIFHDVYPLYGQADIVGSSKKRNKGIQADLLNNLNTVRVVLEKICTQISFPLLNKFIMDVDNGIADLSKEFNSNDESRIIDLLHRHVHPALKMFQRRNPEFSVIIENYFSKLDTDLEVIYDKRKDYEDSVTMINNAIGDYLDEQDRISQEVMPHYFTKYKTDGVEYNLYFGKSLLKNGQFCEMHLHNFRLQQLIDMVNITKLVDNMQGTLPEKLDTAQLVFAYTNTLSIRFREDEKQFDVDGAYNVRYEILKKRIDKAVIEGTTERLTQAGKIAIVYLQDKDRQEYLEYAEYLKHKGFITDNVEELTLGRLQGAQGLRAIRFTVVK